MEEIWKDIVGYEGTYQVSNFGRIRRLSSYDPTGRLKQPKFLKPLNGPRYQSVKLSKNGVFETVAIHRVVMRTFSESPACCPTCATKFEINHKDFNGKNNRLENLEYTTRQQNVDHARIKTQKSHVRVLSDEKVIGIRRLIAEGIAYHKIGKQFNVSKSTISDIKNGRLWKHIPSAPQIPPKK